MQYRLSRGSEISISTLIRRIHSRRMARPGSLLALACMALVACVGTTSCAAPWRGLVPPILSTQAGMCSRSSLGPRRDAHRRRTYECCTHTTDGYRQCRSVSPANVSVSAGFGTSLTFTAPPAQAVGTCRAHFQRQFREVRVPGRGQQTHGHLDQFTVQ